MSWEGYDIIVCENAHMVTLDVYSDSGAQCPECGGAIRGRFTFEYTVEINKLRGML